MVSAFWTGLDVGQIFNTGIQFARDFFEVGISPGEGEVAIGEAAAAGDRLFQDRNAPAPASVLGAFPPILWLGGLVILLFFLRR